MDRVRLALIGAGGIVRGAHMRSLERLRDSAEVVGVYSRRLEKGKAFSAHFGIAKVYEDWRQALSDPSLDAVLVSTPNYTHYPVTVEALRAGKHVFVEKPMALRVEEAQEMEKEAERRGLVLFVGLCLRFWPEYVRSRELILQGSIGEPRVARAYRLKYLPLEPQWYRWEEMSGGVAMDLMIHDLDFLRWTLGEIRRVHALGRSQGIGGALTHVMATLEFRGGEIGYAEASWEMPPGSPFHTYLEVAGRSGMLTVDNRSTWTVEVQGEGQRTYSPFHEDAYLKEMRAFLEGVRIGRSALDPEEGVESVRLGEAVRKSALEGKVVEVRGG